MALFGPVVSRHSRSLILSYMNEERESSNVRHLRGRRIDNMGYVVRGSRIESNVIPRDPIAHQPADAVLDRSPTPLANPARRKHRHVCVRVCQPGRRQNRIESYTACPKHAPTG
eukprot:1238435-Prymnesium_polylepis.2